MLTKEECERALSRLSSKCRSCRYVKTCNHKQMESVSYLEPTKTNISQTMIQPMLKKRDLREIRLDNDITITIDLEELKEPMTIDFFQ